MTAVVAAGGDVRPVESTPQEADAAAEQIGWEYRHLVACDVILFWFPGSPAVQPIALYELGAWAASTKPIVVGADPAYVRRLDVELQLSHVRPGLDVHTTLDAAAQATRAVLEQVLSD